MKTGRMAVVGMAAGLMAAAASGQTILSLGFEDQNASGWTANGVATFFDFGGNPDWYLGIPYMPTNAVSLSAREEASQVFGDLSRYGGAIRISVDVRVFNLINFFEEPMDPSVFPLVLQMWNWDIPADVPVSVYVIGASLPTVEQGWTRVVFEIPDPTRTTLPPGWGGTGAEDPDTYEQRLPDGVTYRDVLANIGQMDISTMLPGYMYSSNYWEVGWDNLLIEVVDDSCLADFNGDGFVNGDDYDAFATLFDIADPGADMNNDGFVNGDDYDLFAEHFDVGC